MWNDYRFCGEWKGDEHVHVHVPWFRAEAYVRGYALLLTFVGNVLCMPLPCRDSKLSSKVNVNLILYVMWCSGGPMTPIQIPMNLCTYILLYYIYEYDCHMQTTLSMYNYYNQRQYMEQPNKYNKRSSYLLCSYTEPIHVTKKITKISSSTSDCNIKTWY